MFCEIMIKKEIIDELFKEITEELWPILEINYEQYFWEALEYTYRKGYERAIEIYGIRKSGINNE